MSAVFVTATGTDIGKTFVAAGLIRYWHGAGQHVDALKPVVSGFDPAAAEQSDAGMLLAAMGRPILPAEIDRISPWRFAAPLSPDMAARREGRTIDFGRLVDFSRRAIAGHRGMLLIEGIGGVMVPLDDRHTVLDWVAALDIPVALVTGSYLGSLSHTLTALDALWTRNVSVKALIANETQGSPVPLDETVATLRRFAGSTPIATLSRGVDSFAALAALLEVDEQSATPARTTARS